VGRMARLGALLIGLAAAALNPNCGVGKYVRARNPLASYARTSTPMGGGSTAMFEEAEESTVGSAHEALVETAGQKVLTVTFNAGRDSVSIGAHSATDTFGKACILASAPATASSSLRGASSARAAPMASGAPRLISSDFQEESERERGLQAAVYVAVPALFLTLGACVVCMRCRGTQVRDLRGSYPYAVEVSPPELRSPVPRTKAREESLTPRSIGAVSTELPDNASAAVSVTVTPRTSRSLTPPPAREVVRSGARSLTPPRGSVARNHTPPRGSAARDYTPPRGSAPSASGSVASRGSRSLTPRLQRSSADLLARHAGGPRPGELPPRPALRDTAPKPARRREHTPLGARAASNGARTRSLTPLGAGRTGRVSLRQTHVLPLPGALP